MESGTFLNENIQKEFGRFVEIVLHTDGRDERFGASSQANLHYLRERFGTVSIPFYAVLDSSGEKIYWRKEGYVNAEEFVAGLQKAPGTN